ncbi:DUF1491 family protein [Aquamicrobium ahrensii]|uniref:DUF1491 family protein n=1 Tax=Aquamicrobium ahrensii TaxID=469551 RepID=UPI00339603D4
MRVTTDLWASALVRRVFGSGGFAAILKRGSSEAGAAFVLVRDRFGEVALYGPAPQTSYDSARPDERLFTRMGDGETVELLEARIEREKRFDPDIWVLEIETGALPVEELVPIKG